MDENYQEAEDTSLLSTVTRWFRTGIAEISCTSRVGHIRLAITGLRNEENKVAQEMGFKICSLLEKSKLKIPEVDDLFLEIRQIEKTIKVREAEIEQIIKDKEVRLLEVSGSRTTPSWTAESPKVKLTPQETKAEPEKTEAAKPKTEKTEVKKAEPPEAGVKAAPRKRKAVKRVGSKTAGRNPRTAKSSKITKKTDVTRKTASQRKLPKSSKPRTSSKTRGSG